MKTRLAATRAICLIFSLAIAAPASAHRLDEYLQATTFSIEQTRVQAQMRLTPGVAVFPVIFATIDTNGDGVLSAAEQRAYAQRVTGDLSLAVDGARLPLRLASWKFAPTAEMKAGRGDIQIEFTADVSGPTHNRKLIFENRHLPRNAVYLVNCLVPRDPNIKVTTQKRNYLQSRYELDYAQVSALSNQRTSAPSRQGSSAGARGMAAWDGMILLLLAAPFVCRLAMWIYLHYRSCHEHMETKPYSFRRKAYRKIRARFGNFAGTTDRG